MITRAANVVPDNFDEQLGTYEPAMDIARRVMRDGLAHVRGKVADDPNIVNGLGNPPLAVTNSRKTSRDRNCTEIGSSRKKAKRGLTEDSLIDVG